MRCHEAPQASPEKPPQGSGPVPRTAGTRTLASSRCYTAPRPEARSCPPEGGQTPHPCCQPALCPWERTRARIALQPYFPTRSRDSGPSFSWSAFGLTSSRLFPPHPVLSLPPTPGLGAAALDWGGGLSSSSLADTWLGGALGRQHSWNQAE